MARGQKLRIAMLPCPAFGHLIPYLEIAKRLAQKGHHISFISTPRNIHRLPRVPQHLAPLVDLVSFPLPPVEGLPSDAEAGSDIPAEDLYILIRANDGLQKSIAEFLETSNLDWVFYDIYMSWLPQIAARFGIRRAFYTAIHTCSLCMCGPSSGRIEDLVKWPPSEDLTRPPNWVPFPSKAKFQQHEVNAILDIITAREEMSSTRLLASVKGCDVIVLRSCMETEDAYLKIIEKIHGKPVIPLGLMPPSIQESEEDNPWKSIKEWLDKNEKHSVVYIAMGSQYLYLTQENFTELALGLELSKLPFFWVAGSSKNHSFHLPDGFEERTKHHGLICTTWAPQIKILAHESIGGFLTHCGTSSTIEALAFGRPLIMLPLIGDQPVTARILGGKNVGIEIPRDEQDGSFTQQSVAEFLRLVMIDEAGKIYRDTAKEMSLIYGEQNLHDRYFDNFEEYISQV